MMKPAGSSTISEMLQNKAYFLDVEGNSDEDR